MCAAKSVAQEFRVKSIDAETVQQTNDEVQCFSCKKGKKHVRPIVQCFLQHCYVPAMNTRQFLCFACIEGPFKQPKIMLDEARRTHVRNTIMKTYPLVFALETELVHARLSSVVDAFFQLYDKGHSVPPSIARDALQVMLIYKRDPNLLQGLMWLNNNKQCISENVNLQGLRPKFEGIGGAWPTVDERSLVYAVSTDSVDT